MAAHGAPKTRSAQQHTGEDGEENGRKQRLAGDLLGGHAVSALEHGHVEREDEHIAALFTLAGAKTELTGAYNGWNPDMESPILKAMTASYEALYGKKPAVTAIHAGLECGIIGSAYPGLDMISFGPTICYPHSPDEKVEIASVGKFYDFLVDTLRNVPEK